MTNFTTADLKRLRELTGAGMLDCKKALEEAEGDFERAIEILRLKGAKDVGKRATRTAANGLVTTAFDDTRVGVLLELNCETDFVAKTEPFQQAAAAIAEHVVRTAPPDVPALLDSEITPGKTVRQLVEETSATLGEKLELRRFARFEGTYVASYLHKSDPALPPTTGVLVELDTENPAAAKDVAQQIAAMAPRYLSRDAVPSEVVAKERALAEQMAREEGKPERAIPKIVEGRVNSFYKDFVLLDQPFVKDGKLSVGQMLHQAGVSVRRFARFRAGQS